MHAASEDTVQVVETCAADMFEGSYGDLLKGQM